MLSTTDFSQNSSSKNSKISPKIPFLKIFKKRKFWFWVFLIVFLVFYGGLVAFLSGIYFYNQVENYLSNLKIENPKIEKIIEKEYIPQTSQEEKIIEVVKKVSPSVVSIVITKDVPIIEEYYFNPFEGFEEFFGDFPFKFRIPEYRQKGTEKKEVGGGTGFIISEDGMVLTNKHVVLDEKADYTVFTNDGQKFPAKVIAKDPLQDLAIIKIESNEKFTPIKLGDSDNLEIGQTVIAIGNALGEFRNTVSVGVISGLGRTVTASGGGFIETIEDVIQTDAAINKGNSGGPLLNLKGEVIGINTAMALGAQNIGFAIPINKAKKDIEQVKTLGKIVYPFLGVRYLLINERVQKEYNLGVNYGALVKEVIPQSPAFKAALKEKDIILEFNGEKITPENSLKKIIEKYNPGDKVFLKILRKGQKKIFEVILGEWEE